MSTDFEDCLEKQWFRFNLKLQNQLKLFEKSIYPYQTINSLKFYEKIQSTLNDNFELKLNSNIKTITKQNDIFEIKTENINIKSKLIFDSRVPKADPGNLYQHFYGYEIETIENHFNENIVTLAMIETKEAVENMIAQYVNVLAKIFENEAPVKKLTAQRPEDNENV